MKKKTDFTEKPYNRCLSCPHRKVRCDGPRTAGLTLDRWCEYMRDMKDANGLTNAYIAEESGVSIKTIERLMAQNADQDIMRETARRIENAIIGSTSKYPCYLAFEEENRPSEQKFSDIMRDLERAMADNQDYRVALDNIHNAYATEMQTIRSEAKTREENLLTQVERLRQEIDYLRLENDRKARIIDKFLDK